MNLLRSNFLNPTDNIAVEESLLHEGAENSLLFWQSDRAVVLGKNQNPWRECNLAYCREHRIQLARRFTGGGCVYQDTGNLNYAVVMPREGYSMCKLLDAIASSFSEAGIAASRILENSLGVAGRKFSGHAFCYRRDRVLHHGTLLVNANLDHLSQSLQPVSVDLSSHAVASKPANVCNLVEFQPDLSLDAVQRIVIDGIANQCGESVGEEKLIELKDFHGLESRQKFASNDWIWGQTPAFSLEGDVEGQPFTIRIRKCRIDAVQGLAGADTLVGCSLNRMDVERTMQQIDAGIQTALRNTLSSFLLDD